MDESLQDPYIYISLYNIYIYIYLKCVYSSKKSTGPHAQLLLSEFQICSLQDAGRNELLNVCLCRDKCLGVDVLQVDVLGLPSLGGEGPKVVLKVAGSEWLKTVG